METTKTNATVAQCVTWTSHLTDSMRSHHQKRRNSKQAAVAEGAFRAAGSSERTVVQGTRPCRLTASPTSPCRTNGPTSKRWRCRTVWHEGSGKCSRHVGGKNFKLVSLDWWSSPNCTFPRATHNVHLPDGTSKFVILERVHHIGSASRDGGGVGAVYVQSVVTG